MDRTPSRPVDPGPNRTQGPSPARLGVSQAARLQQARPASAPRQGRSDDPRDLQKNLPERLNEVQQAFPDATVELWATDQHRVGLKPILCRIWVPKRSRPSVTVQHHFQSLYVYVRYHQRPLSQRCLARSDVPPPSK